MITNTLPKAAECARVEGTKLVARFPLARLDQRVGGLGTNRTSRPPSSGRANDSGHAWAPAGQLAVAATTPYSRICQKQGPSLKARLYFHPGNQLRVVKGAIETRSGASPTVYVVGYDANSGRCKVLIVGSEEERWEEAWDLTKPHGPERATFMRGQDGDFSSIEVQLESS